MFKGMLVEITFVINKRFGLLNLGQEGLQNKLKGGIPEDRLPNNPRDLFPNPYCRCNEIILKGCLEAPADCVKPFGM
jgi:hypothetical protein